MQAREQLLQLALLYEGDWENIYKAIVEKKYPKVDIEYTGNYITILDDKYQESLKQSQRPPFVLFYEGNLDILTNNKPKIAVGTSRLSQEEQERIVDIILKDVNCTFVLSGTSKIDEYIEKNTENEIIVVANTPIENVKTKFKNEKTLILSEYPPKTIPSILCAPRGTEIIASLCTSTLVLRCTKTSSTNILIMCSLQNNKDVMVVPTSPLESESVSNNQLIYEGAIPVWTNKGLCEIIN